ncbi:MAG: hypothetical protein PHD97_04020, partial [Bacteroidales bacterium]|nr:hypothetical protein [Bacteroidales bacterium]
MLRNLKHIALFILLFHLSVNVIADTHTSKQSGDWTTGATWVGNVAPASTDNAIIVDGTNVAIPNGGTGTVKDLTINDGGVISIGNKTLTITGNLVFNGAIISTHQNADIHMNGAGATVDGTGYIDLTTSKADKQYFYVDNNISFLSTADLLFTSCQIQIANSMTLTNNGIVTIENGILGGNASSTWTNAANSTLICGNVILATGILNASASGNTVEYYGAVVNDVKLPSSSQYYNLTISGSAIKSLTGNTDINGNLTISGIFDVTNANNYKITLAGNWSNSNTFSCESGEVEFDGSGDQTITNTNTGTETFYNLKVNKSAGTLTLNNNTTVLHTLTMTQGNIVSTATALLTLGDGTGTQEGTLSRTAGTIVGEFERWCSQTGFAYLFPIGTSTYYRPVTQTFNS